MIVELIIVSMFFIGWLFILKNKYKEEALHWKIKYNELKVRFEVQEEMAARHWQRVEKHNG